MVKNTLSQSFRQAILLLPCLLAGCDSGDVYPVRIEERGESIAVAARFVLSGDIASQNYQLCFAAFDEGGASPEVWTHVAKPQNTDTVSVSIGNIPPRATTVRLCLLTIGRRAIYDFFTFDISHAENDIEIPLRVVPLHLAYEKIQDIFENNTCTACHGTENGGAGLLLGAGKSYENLVGIPARNSPKKRVEPGNVAGSFLIDVLTSDTLQLGYPHSAIVNNLDELNLLKAWIEELGTEN
ncbi:MAG: hypothetical protein LBF08_02410 [Dysgonamonadaceae bacterium]|jgi:hypothetical protein|nr:hypothetical protein [Dysgonamonadaceae bacterium]